MYLKVTSLVWFSTLIKIFLSFLIYCFTSSRVTTSRSNSFSLLLSGGCARRWCLLHVWAINIRHDRGISWLFHPCIRMAIFHCLALERIHFSKIGNLCAKNRNLKNIVQLLTQNMVNVKTLIRGLLWEPSDLGIHVFASALLIGLSGWKG